MTTEQKNIRSEFKPANDATLQSVLKPARYVATHGYGFNAATTDIIRTGANQIRV